MSTNVKKVKILGVVHDIEDTQARTDIRNIKSNISTLQSTDARLDDVLNEKLNKSEVGNYSSASVSSTTPISDNTQIWINPENEDNFSVPEIKDDTVNATDTWSSRKIDQELSSLKSNIDSNTANIKNNKISVDTNLKISGNAADAKVTGDAISSLKEDLNELKEQGIGGGSGIPQAQKTNLAKAIRQELAFASTSHPFIDAFLAWLESGSDTPPEDKPTAPTLTGITVTWSAESADVGTDPKTLITSVKAVYSDGSQQTATGYSVTPSALVEGDNNVVVSYDGMSETKSITGIVPEVDVIVYRPAEDCPDGWNVVTIDGDTDISIPIFNNNPSGENGVTFAEVNITDICSYGNTSVNNIKMPSQFMFNNNLNDVNLKGVSNVCCAVFWQNKRYLQFGLSSSDCGTTVESIKQYLARYNYVFYVR